ncbi:HupE/UreJ family protein [Sanguibacter antarcticus]|uniref:HupE/UreJ protein n=1 Tax=Sanguibacter antarcticus TaxID=372484 RepID=A0A2A9E820_9MICO|nr:HupE/UreJ family protein [Sanguibacter antarcticus]PFG34455.1 HupE/UreJ protein [Sanguibacter antarcticus]
MLSAPTTNRWLAAAAAALWCAVSIVVGAVPASAHDSTGDAIALTLTDRRIVVTAPVLFTELGYEDTTGDGLVDADEMRAQEQVIATGLVGTVRDHVRIEIDGLEVEIIGAGPAPTEGSQGDPSQYVELQLATGPHDDDVSQVSLAWSFTTSSSQVLLSSAQGAVAGHLADDGTVSVSVSISLDAGTTVRSFFVTGTDHVGSGLDHLLFLVVLTFAVVGSTVTRASTWRVVGLVTAFTVGHATSLCLAYFDVVSVPAHWVEPAISLSIVAAAVLAVCGRGDTIRPWLAGLVGLVHGLGFASSLSSLGLVTTYHVGALAAFNIGIDVAQTLVVLVVTGAIWAVGRLLPERSGWLRVVVCSGAGLAGLFWTVSRLVS